MRCPACKTDLTRVIRTEPGEDGTRRRRKCLDPQCGHRWTTFEAAVVVDDAGLIERAGSDARTRRRAATLPAGFEFDAEAIAAALAVDRRRARVADAERDLERRARERDDAFYDPPPARLTRETFAREVGHELPED